MKLLNVQAIQNCSFCRKDAVCIICYCHKLCASDSSPKIRCYHLGLKWDAWKYGCVLALWFGWPVFPAICGNTCHKGSRSQTELLCELKSLTASHHGMNTWYPLDRKFHWFLTSVGHGDEHPKSSHQLRNNTLLKSSSSNSVNSLCNWLSMQYLLQRIAHVITNNCFIF